MNILEKTMNECRESGINSANYGKIISLYSQLFKEQLDKGLKLGLFLLDYSIQDNYLEFIKTKEKEEEIKYLFDWPVTQFSQHLDQYRLGKLALPSYQEIIQYSKDCEKIFINHGLKIIQFLYKNHENYAKITQLIQKIEKE